MKKLIVKNNKLISARYKLSTVENKLITIILMKFQENPDCETFEISQHVIKEIYKPKDNNFIKIMIESFHSIMSRRIRIDLDNGDILLSRWFASILIKKNGIIEFDVARRLKPYLKDLKANFTKVEVDSILNMNSFHACRLYELMKKRLVIGNLTFTILEIKELLKINKREYKTYGSFKQCVLIRSITQINKHTDIRVSIKEFRRSRKVVKIQFKIRESIVVEKEKESI